MLRGVETVEIGDDAARQFHFNVHGMAVPGVGAGAQGCERIGRNVGEQLVVRPHALVGNRHQLAEHFAGHFGDAHVIAQALGHFALAIEPHQDGHGQDHLLGLIELALNFASHQQIEFLLGGAQLHIGLEHHGIVGHQQRIEQLVNGDGLIACQARAKVFVLQHPCQAVFSAQPHNIVAGELSQPFAVVANFGFSRVQNFVHLREVGFCVFLHLLGRERGTRLGLSGRVAHQRGKISHQENRRVPQVLKMF